MDVSENAVVDFAFEGEVVPAYRVAYVEPPIVADGSGMELDLDGVAFLEVVVSPGAGVDLSGEEPRETFTGEDRFTVDSVDGIVELVENGDFESVLTWTIGLTARHPFSVDARPGSLTIDLEVPDDTTASLLGAEPATCTSADGFTVSYPSDWWASTGELACGSFAPTELHLAPNTDVTAPVMIFADPVEFETVVSPSQSREELSRAVTTLDGRQAVRIVSNVEEGLYAPGTEVTSYFVELEPIDEEPRTLIATTADVGDYEYERNAALLDEMFRTIELDEPGPENLVAMFRGGGAPFEVTAVDDSGSQICLAVSPGESRACLTAPAGNRVVGDIVGDVIVGLSGPDVFRVEVEDGLSFLPVELDSGTHAWAAPFDGTDFEVLGSDGDTVLIETIS